jgi:aspartate carbamoyltransferase catalytic subunit
MKLHHVIEAQQFDSPTLLLLFDTAVKMEQVVARGGTSDFERRIMATLFYEPSTRTRFSFETAMHRLGGQVISTENAAEFSSVAKGETLEDTIQILNGYADVIVLRHYEVGAAKRAAAVSKAPVINAGDGAGQHPTQSLLDLYTIRKEIGTIDGLKIALVGDLAQGRTVRSLTYLLSKYQDIKMYFVAPTLLKMKEDILEHIINRAALQLMRPKSIVLHPLPRLEEISMEVDSDPRAAYFRQAQNGLYVRMALLTMVLD